MRKSVASIAILVPSKRQYRTVSQMQIDLNCIEFCVLNYDSPVLSLTACQTSVLEYMSSVHMQESMDSVLFFSFNPMLALYVFIKFSHPLKLNTDH